MKIIFDHSSYFQKAIMKQCFRCNKQSNELSSRKQRKSKWPREI